MKLGWQPWRPVFVLIFALDFVLTKLIKFVFNAVCVQQVYLFVSKVHCIASRQSSPNPFDAGLNFADLSRVLPQCGRFQLEGHDHRVSGLAWHSGRSLLASWLVSYTPGIILRI